MPTVIIPPPYRGPTQGASQVEVEAGTVREALDAVESQYPGFGPQVFSADGSVHRFVKLFLAEELLDSAGLDRALTKGDFVTVIAAIAGG
ncbi:MAG: MoaD/ThiS family protein [bacterium]|nr:MoaD/ThiS family protein [bacterium]